MDNLLTIYLFLKIIHSYVVSFVMPTRDLDFKAVGIQETGNYKWILGIVTCATISHIPAKWPSSSREGGFCKLRKAT
jgi:hypothetical protein